MIRSLFYQRKLNGIQEDEGVFVPLILLSVLIVIQIFINSNLMNYSLEKEINYVERQYKLNPEVIKAFSFGHLASVIDWFWMTSVIDGSAGSHVAPGQHPQLYYDLDLISDLDPAFFEIYTVGANLLSIIRNDGEGAKNLLKKGNDFFKNHISEYPSQLKEMYWGNVWSLHTLLAYVHLFELDDLPSAASEFLAAADLPGAPKYLLRLAKRLTQNGGVYEVGLRLLNFLISGQTDPKLKAALEKKRLNLSIGHYLFQVNESYKAFLNKHPKSKDLDYFLKANGVGNLDPWGGKLYLDRNGRILSSTPHDRVFNLD